jgi:hypothetical protein
MPELTSGIANRSDPRIHEARRGWRNRQDSAPGLNRGPRLGPGQSAGSLEVGSWLPRAYPDPTGAGQKLVILAGSLLSQPLPLELQGLSIIRGRSRGPPCPDWVLPQNCHSERVRRKRTTEESHPRRELLRLRGVYPEPGRGAPAQNDTTRATFEARPPIQSGGD